MKLPECRIGFFTSVVGMGGSEVLVADAMEAAAEKGAAIRCWCAPHAAVRDIVVQRTGMSVEFLDWPKQCNSNCSKPKSAISNKSYSRTAVARLWRGIVPAVVRQVAGFRRDAHRFYQELRRNSPDLLFVNVNGSEAASLGGHWWSRERTINCYHLSFTPSNGLVDRLLRRQTIYAAETTVHTSHAVRDQWCHAFGYPESKTRVIYNGVKTRTYSDRKLKRAELGLSPETFVFCVPGRLHPMKGHRYLLTALASCKDQLRKSLVLIAGDGELSAELESLCQANGISEQVRFLGFRNDLPDILHACDGTILPSIASENLSVAVLESLMAGTPAIVTRVGGMAEAIEEGRTGFVVPPCDAKSLADAILRMIRSSDLGSMRKQSVEQARQRFSRRRMMDEYSALFAETLGTCK